MEEVNCHALSRRQDCTQSSRGSVSAASKRVSSLAGSRSTSLSWAGGSARDPGRFDSGACVVGGRVDSPLAHQAAQPVPVLTLDDRAGIHVATVTPSYGRHGHLGSGGSRGSLAARTECDGQAREPCWAALRGRRLTGGRCGPRRQEDRGASQLLRHTPRPDAVCRLQEEGSPLGSGAVESCVRRVVNLRLKGNGIFWCPESAEGVLHLRAQLLCGRWNQFVKTVLRPRQLWDLDPTKARPIKLLEAAAQAGGTRTKPRADAFSRTRKSRLISLMSGMAARANVRVAR